MKNETAMAAPEVKKRKKFSWTRDDSELALLGLPATIWFAVFAYLPMFGLIIAFKSFKLQPGMGFLQSLFASDWAGFKNFTYFLTSNTFSMLLRFGPGFPVTLGASEAVTVTHIAALAVRDYLLTKGIDSRIKWPNDIWVGDRKICGMLIENSSCGGRLVCSIAGIGLNVNENSWPPELPNPVSMKELLGKSYILADELAELVGRLRARYSQAASGEGRLALDEEFGKYVFRLPSKP